MVIVAVANDHRIYPGELPPGEAGRSVAPGAGKGNGRGPLAKDGVGQKIETGNLYQESGMPYPGHLDPTWIRAIDVVKVRGGNLGPVGRDFLRRERWVLMGAQSQLPAEKTQGSFLGRL
jgi:hypothetical protein